MVTNLRVLAAEGAARWRLALIISGVMTVMLVLGLLARHPFIASVTVDIGGVVNMSESTQFRPFEEASAIEMFFSHEIFGPRGRYSACTATSVYSPDGGRLKIVCKGGSDSEARELVSSALEPFFARHSRYFELAKNSEERRQKLLERRLRGAERKIDVLQRQPVSSFAEAEIVDCRLEIETLHDQMASDRLLGDRIKNTRVDVHGIKVLNRTPSLGTWFAVLVLSIGSGIFMAVFMARLNDTRGK